jgi:hypothetical protein
MSESHQRIAACMSVPMPVQDAADATFLMAIA